MFLTKFLNFSTANNLWVSTNRIETCPLILYFSVIISPACRIENTQLNCICDPDDPSDPEDDPAGLRK